MYLKQIDNDLAAWRKHGQTRRRLRRWSVSIQATVWIDDAPVDCTVTDLSPAGSRVKLTQSLAVDIGTDVVLHLEGYGSIPAEVRYSDGEALGLMFLHDDSREVDLARYLVSQRPARQAPRRKVSVQATLTPRKAQARCTIDDVSRSGASVLINGADGFTEGDEVVLTVEGHGDIIATVRRVGEGRLGLMFSGELEGKLPF